MLKFFSILIFCTFAGLAHALDLGLGDIFMQMPEQVELAKLGQGFRSGGGGDGIAQGIANGVNQVLPNAVGVQVSSLGESSTGGSYSHAKKYGVAHAVLLDPQGKVVMNGSVAGCHGFRDMGSGTIGCENNSGVDPLTINGIKESKGFVDTDELAKKRSWSSDEIADSIDFDLCKPALNKIESKKYKKANDEGILARVRNAGNLNSNATKIKIGNQELEIEAMKPSANISATCRVKGLSKKLDDCYAVFLNRDGRTLECRTAQGPRKVELKTTQEERREVFESAYAPYLDSGKNMSGDDFVKLWKDKMQFRPNIEDIYNRSKGTATASGGSGSPKSGTR